MEGVGDQDHLARLVEKARTDESSLERLISSYLPRLRAFIRSRIDPELRLKESVSDLVQSVCRDLLTRGSGFEFRGEAAFRSWLFTAALNKIRERHRFHRQMRRSSERETSLATVKDSELLSGYSSICTPSQALSLAEQIAILERAMDELDPDHREVIAYARLAGLPIRDIAPRMGRSEEAVRKLLGRALLKLTALLKRHGLRPAGETA